MMVRHDRLRFMDQGSSAPPQSAFGDIHRGVLVTPVWRTEAGKEQLRSGNNSPHRLVGFIGFRPCLIRVPFRRFLIALFSEMSLSDRKTREEPYVSRWSRVPSGIERISVYELTSTITMTQSPGRVPHWFFGPSNSDLPQVPDPRRGPTYKIQGAPGSRFP